MSDDVARLTSRIDRLEASYDALKVVRPMLLAVLGVFLAAGVFVLNNLAQQVQATNARLDQVNVRIDAVSAKVDAIPQRLAEEFRSMRTEMAAQTTAIANSITAARQMQPQVLVVPIQPSPPPP